MISFSSLSFEGSLQTGSLLSSFFGADIKLRYLEFLEAPLCCGAAGGLKVIMTSSETFRPNWVTNFFMKKPRGGDIERKAYLWEFKY